MTMKEMIADQYRRDFILERKASRVNDSNNEWMNQRGKKNFFIRKVEKKKLSFFDLLLFLSR